MISQSGAYSRLVSPAPFSSCGKNKFHNPSRRAFGFSSSTIRVGFQRSCSISSWNRFSFGYTWASIKLCSRFCSSFVFALSSKSIGQRSLLLAGEDGRTLFDKVRHPFFEIVRQQAFQHFSL